MNQQDLIVIGAGPGGYVAAIRAAQLGMSVAVVEKDAVGGTCLNRGCIPTKALLHAGEVLDEMREASKLGLSCENISYDMAAVYKRRDDIVKKVSGGVELLFKSNKITLYRGVGSFVDKNTDTFGKRRQVPGYLVQVSGGFGVEDKTDHIYT